MPAPLLIVELPANEPVGPETAALVRACSEGLGSGRCVLAQDRPAEPAAAVAVVSWRSSAELGAVVEVGRRRHQTQSWRSEELSFLPQDQRMERFRTVGFAIATLFREAEQQDETERATGKKAAPAERPPSASTRAKAPPTGDTGKPPTRRGASANTGTPHAGSEASSDSGADSNPTAHDPVARSPHAPAWFSAGASTGYNRELFRWRFGGRVELGGAPWAPPVFLTAVAGYAGGSGPSGVSLAWATVGLGAGGMLALPAGFELRGALRATLVDVAGQVTDPVRGSDASHVWLPGGEAELALIFPARGPYGFALTGLLEQLSKSTPIRVHDRDLGVVGASSWGAGALLELRPFQR
jgi:hypothetical protein